MENNEIRTFQDILRQNKRFDLAYKFDKAEYKLYCYDNWNGGQWRTIFFADPKYFFELSELGDGDRGLLIKLLNAMYFGDCGDCGEISDIEFRINKNLVKKTFDDVLYIFVDESGDMDFSQKGSNYYMFSFLVKKRPFKLQETIASYRYALLERNLKLKENEKRLNIEKFHACEDNSFVRGHIFDLISSFEQEAIKIYSYILEKPKVNPDKTLDKPNFYAENLKYAITRLLDKIGINQDFIVITDSLAVKKDKNKQIGAIKGGIKEYLIDKNLNVRYDIFHHSSASSVNLQIVDYINWAIFRKYEKDDREFYEKISKHLLDEENMTKDKDKRYY